LLILGRDPGQLEAVPVQVGTHLLDELAHSGLGCADGTELLVDEVGGIDGQVGELRPVGEVIAVRYGVGKDPGEPLGVGIPLSLLAGWGLRLPRSDAPSF
jgi:hypothetical protein